MGNGELSMYDHSVSFTTSLWIFENRFWVACLTDADRMRWRLPRSKFIHHYIVL